MGCDDGAVRLHRCVLHIGFYVYIASTNYKSLIANERESGGSTGVKRSPSNIFGSMKTIGFQQTPYQALHLSFRGSLQGTVSAQLYLQWSETKRRELLGRTEDNSISSTRGHSFVSQANR